MRVSRIIIAIVAVTMARALDGMIGIILTTGLVIFILYLIIAPEQTE